MAGAETALSSLDPESSLLSMKRNGAEKRAVLVHFDN